MASNSYFYSTKKCASYVGKVRDVVTNSPLKPLVKEIVVPETSEIYDIELQLLSSCAGITIKDELDAFNYESDNWEPPRILQCVNSNCRNNEFIQYLPFELSDQDYCLRILNILSICIRKQVIQLSRKNNTLLAPVPEDEYDILTLLNQILNKSNCSQWIIDCNINSIPHLPLNLPRNDIHDLFAYELNTNKLKLIQSVTIIYHFRLLLLNPFQQIFQVNNFDHSSESNISKLFHYAKELIQCFHLSPLANVSLLAMESLYNQYWYHYKWKHNRSRIFGWNIKNTSSNSNINLNIGSTNNEAIPVHERNNSTHINNTGVILCAPSGSVTPTYSSPNKLSQSLFPSPDSKSKLFNSNTPNTHNTSNKMVVNTNNSPLSIISSSMYDKTVTISPLKESINAYNDDIANRNIDPAQLKKLFIHVIELINKIQSYLVYNKSLERINT